MNIISRKISDLVTEYYGYAAVLHDFGIEFYHYNEQTVEEACQAKGLNTKQIIHGLLQASHQVDKNQPENLANYPIDLLIQYLRFNHDNFTKEKLPYMSSLIQNLDNEIIKEKQIIKDLQLLFPLFIDDFIHHIHEEENIFFNHISLLFQASQGKYNAAKLYYQMEKYSIQYFALDHHNHDGEMSGIRELTNNYDLDSNPSLHLRVIFSELKALETDLKTHARIEDEILFIKALHLEKQVKEMLNKKSQLN